MKIKFVLFAAVSAVALFSTSAEGLSARSYVQRGLVANWDGIENAGRYGEHRASITAWKDLISDVAWKLPANAVIETNGVTYAGTAASWSADPDETAATAAKVYTIGKVRNGTLESVFYVASSSSAQILFGGASYHVSLRANGSTDTLTLYASGGGGKVKAACPVVGYTNTACVTFSSDTPQTAYTNGLATTLSGSDRIDTTSSAVTSGKDLAGTIFAMRMYAVPLTADEARYNAAVDAVRFKGADPETAFAGCTLARWNATKKCLEAKLSVTTTGAGTFALNGGAFSASVDQWVALGEQVSLVYTASGEQPMWMDLPAYAARDEGDGCSASFTMSGPITARVVPAQIVYVADTALGDGSAWNAATNWNGALDVATAATGPVAIWVTGPVTLTATPVAKVFTQPLVIRGGFAGTETSLAQRALGARTRVFGNSKYNHLNFSNAEQVTLDGLALDGFAGTALKRTQSNGSLVLTNCAIRGYTSATTHGATLTGAAGARLQLVDTSVEGCGRSGDFSTHTGVGMSATGFGRTEFENVFFVTNALGGLRKLNGSALYLKNTRFALSNTRFIGNRAYGEYNNGQVIRFDGDCDGSTVSNCAFVGNYECKQSEKGGIISVNFARDADRLAFENCTFAYNIVRRWNSSSCTDATALNVLVGNVTVRNSVFWGNVKQSGCTAGVDLKAFGTSSLTAKYCLFGGSGSDYWTREDTATLTVNESTCVLGSDPLFVTPTADFMTMAGITSLPIATPAMGSLTADEAVALDVHLLSTEGYRVNGDSAWHQAAVQSPAIDKGDPDDDVRAEKAGHNGGRLNLGAYGGTASASQTMACEPAITGDVLVTFDGEYTQPTVRFKAGGTGTYSADVTLRVSIDGGAFSDVVVTRSGVTNGQDVAILMPEYYQPGAVIKIRVDIAGGGSTATKSSEDTEVVGTLPPWYGKGGGANVIHVRADATGKGTGANWTDALTDFHTALAQLGGTKTEVWFAGDLALTAVPSALDVAVPTAFRGGFAATENSAAERAVGARSVLSCGDTYTPFKFTNSATVTLDGLEIRRAYDYAVLKSGGDGDLVVTNCAVIHPYINAQMNVPNGMKLTGTTAASLTVVDSWFSECMTLSVYGSRSDTQSGAVYVSGFGSATFDRCLFTSNGVGCASAAGKAIKAINTPVTVRDARFIGNDSYGEYAGGSIVHLSGAVGGSEIRNCAFVGNAERCSFTRGCVTLDASEGGALLVDNCTFAYNTSARNPGDSEATEFDATGLNVRSGHATVRNCIFWANASKVANTGAADIGVFAGATADVSSCLFAASTTNYLMAAEGGTLNLATNSCVFADPLFVTPTADFMALMKIETLPKVNCTIDPKDAFGLNVHLRGKFGYKDETTGELVRFRRTVSPAIDAGDPASDRSQEAKPNGGRVNLGFYGNTPYATMSSEGLILIVK